MTDYISREAALLSMTPIVKRASERNRNILSAVKQCVEAINWCPAADVAPLRHGRWKKSYADNEAFGVRPFFLYCSECHKATVHQYTYCPNCGARMDGDGDGTIN